MANTRNDPALYDLLAFVDPLRIGGARERKLAEKEIAHRLKARAATKYWYIACSR